MRQFFIGLFIVLAVAGLEFACTRPAHAQTATNAIKMGYNLVTVSQTVVFNSTMQTGGTMVFTAKAMDGGGRAPGDPFTMKLVFYNSSNQVINTVQQVNTLTYGDTTPQNYSMTTTNCGATCTGVAYVSAEFYGKDGGYWAGNYGPYITEPTLTFNGGSNILYNPEFGVYGTNGYAQGWASTAGWQNCALYSGAATCVINNGAQVNGGTYSATGGTTSGTSGGYTAAPPAPTYTSDITTAQQNRVTAAQNRSIVGNSIYINQVGDNNNVSITQVGRNNTVTGIGQQDAPIQGNSNNITLRQGSSAIATDKNEINMRVVGDSNTVNANQGVTVTGANVQSTNNHYQSVDVYGAYNAITTQQTNTGGAGGHYMETTVNGNSNNVTAKQIDNGNKMMFTSISGDNNTVTATQSGTGQHYLETVLIGNGNSATVSQTGNTQNRASISITNAGGPGSIDLQQTGGQVYNISTTCVTAGGCAPVVVRQGN